MRFVLLLVFVLSGCAPFYTVPNDAADFAALGLLPPESAEEITAALERQPAAHFPATLATVRLQGRGNSWVINLRTVEGAGDMDNLASMPGIREVIPLSQIVCPGQVSRLETLRSAAASVRADLVLVYTFESTSTSEPTIPLLGLLSLGILPNEIARATSTGSGALVDTRTGYIYGLTEATRKEYRITNAWNVRDAMESSMEGAQGRACKDLVAQVEKLWDGVLARYGKDLP